MHPFTIITIAETTEETIVPPLFAFGYFDKKTITQIISDIKALKLIQHKDINDQIYFAKHSLDGRLLYLRVAKNKKAFSTYTFNDSVMRYGNINKKEHGHNIIEDATTKIINKISEFVILEGNWTNNFIPKQIIFNEIDTTIILGPKHIPPYISFGAKIKGSQHGYMTPNIPFPLSIN